jgi:3-oxoacyl-[acyl-carrier protein] reductase
MDYYKEAKMRLDFCGKTAVVTGATRGIGKDIADKLTALGARLLLTGTDKAQIRALNASLKKCSLVRYYHLDLLEDRSIERFLSEAKKAGPIDICINNAGINRINSIENVKTGDWDDIVRVNLRGPFMISRGIGMIMKKAGRGRIVNMASILGVITRGKRAAYTATKAGLIGLTKTSAVDLAPYNVLVNAVSPGFVMTDLTKRILSKGEMSVLKAAIPLGRFASPDEISRVVIFLASDLNTYLTGQNIIVDGGYVDI